MKRACVALGLFLLMTTAACQSAPVKLPSASIGPNEKSLGKTEGTSTGLMLFGVIPIVQNSRFENAYVEAVRKSGGTRLTDVTISEQWFWAVVLNGYIFTVQGTAVGSK